MSFFRKVVTWSPVEEEFLRTYRDSMPVDQLCIALCKSRNAIKNKKLEFDGKLKPKGKNKKTKIGRREDLDQFFRSGWEANCCRWFNHQGWKWEYEPEVFFFKGIKKGTVSYCPDFKVDNMWVEVKGQLTQKGKTAIKRFQKFYPEEFAKLRAIPGRPNTDASKFFESLGVPILAYYNDLDKEFKKVIDKWE